MAQAKKGSLSAVWMVLAFVAIGVFIYWLGQASEPTSIAVATEGEQTRIVGLGEYAQNPMAFEDERIELSGVEVQEALGVHAFVFEVSGMGSYLVRLNPTVVQEGLIALPGDRGRMVGTVHMMTDSVLDAWQAQGVFAGDPAHRTIAASVPSYFYAHEMELTSTGAETPSDPAEAAAPAAPGTNEE